MASNKFHLAFALAGIGASSIETIVYLITNDTGNYYASIVKTVGYGILALYVSKRGQTEK
ncbi:hypothetical protein [Bacillus toyonensis]|uniref:hypothetical protein n=1 Tax=Bacillus toyonensis TaxID=155322 RepID=UPI002E1E45E4|nr:hypothetical protein [Bacillus toyonensis]